MTEQIVETEPPVAFVPELQRTERMAKLMFSLRKEYLRAITLEAKSRGITVQELLRAVIVPDWVRERDEKRADSLRPRSGRSSFDQRR